MRFTDYREELSLIYTADKVFYSMILVIKEDFLSLTLGISHGIPRVTGKANSDREEVGTFFPVTEIMGIHVPVAI